MLLHEFRPRAEMKAVEQVECDSSAQRYVLAPLHTPTAEGLAPDGEVRRLRPRIAVLRVASSDDAPIT